jgi:ArsR family transcriptional regulator
MLGESSVTALAETFKVLGDETRVRIIDVLSKVQGGGASGLNNDLCVQDLAGILGMTQSAVSHQLRLLRSMRLVRTRRDGRQIFYALDDDHIVKLFEQGLEHVQERAAPRDRKGPHERPRPYRADEVGTRAEMQKPDRQRRVLETRERHGASVSARGGGAPREIKK